MTNPAVVPMGRQRAARLHGAAVGSLRTWLVVHGMLAVPALGAISWFGGIDATAEPHALLANVLMVLAGAHALMALYHQYVLKDDLLGRMTRPR